MTGSVAFSVLAFSPHCPLYNQLLCTECSLLQENNMDGARNEKMKKKRGKKVMPKAVKM